MYYATIKAGHKLALPAQNEAFARPKVGKGTANFSVQQGSSKMFHLASGEILLMEEIRLTS